MKKPVTMGKPKVTLEVYRGALRWFWRCQLPKCASVYAPYGSAWKTRTGALKNARTYLRAMHCYDVWSINEQVEKEK